MNDTTSIKAELRTGTKKSDNHKLKANGYILGNIVGKGLDSVAVAIKKDTFRKALRSSGRNSVFSLEIADGQKYSVMVQEIQREISKNEIAHVDFKVVSFTEKMKQEVAVKIIGAENLEPKKLLINSQVNSIVVEGLPQGIPDEIEVDVTNLEAGDSILLKDIELGEGISSSLDPEQKIVSVVGSKLEEAAESEDEEEAASE